jgi:hypothetical protein
MKSIVVQNKPLKEYHEVIQKKLEDIELLSFDIDLHEERGTNSQPNVTWVEGNSNWIPSKCMHLTLFLKKHSKSQQAYYNIHSKNFDR